MADVINIFDGGKDYIALATEKLDAESKGYKGDRYGNAVHTYVANALRSFIQQDARFAEVFYKTKRTFSDCVKEIMKGCGSSISDIEVYRRATKFYFPNSEVEFILKITTEEAPDEEYMSKEAPKESERKPAPAKKPEKKAADKAPAKKAPVKKEKKKEPEVLQLSLF